MSAISATAKHKAQSSALGFSFVLLILIATGCESAPPRVFNLDATRLHQSRRSLQPNHPALQKLRRDASIAMTLSPPSVMDKKQMPPSGDKHDYMSQAPYYWPDPSSPTGLPYIRRDGERNPEIRKITDRTNLREMIDAVQTLSFAYYFTGNETYAARATTLLRTWFIHSRTRMNPQLEYAQGIPGINTGRGIGIIETQRLTDVIDAIALLDGSRYWTTADQRAMHEWFDDYLTWMLESRNGRDEAAAKNNHGTHYDVQVVTDALFVGRRDVAIDVLKQVPQKRIAVQIDADGKQLLELERTKAWSYSVMNLRGLLQLAHLGKHVGIDLCDERMRKALEFLTPYARGEKRWPYQQINGFRPEGGLTLLRWVNKTPPPDPADLDHLTGPRLYANPLDSN